MRKSESLVSIKFIDEYIMSHKYIRNASKVLLIDNIDKLCPNDNVHSHFPAVLENALPSTNCFVVASVTSLSNVNKDLLKSIAYYKIILLNKFTTSNIKQIFYKYNCNYEVPARDQTISFLYCAINGLSVKKQLKVLPNKKIEIGGMKAVKQSIQDYILLPIQYPKLFANTRLPKGILLYGPSGCGKTLFGNSLALIPSISYYSVKGPELLGKYIGQSEQNIRELFEKAQETEPSIIFFDEFDSLAPVRGEGSSGITDRIVNQLLTYLDGVEERGNVYIVAASSRPQSIDPAVLRAGRIGLHLYCGFPDAEERKEILLMDFNEATEVLINATDGYTGADLHALHEEYQRCKIMKIDSDLVGLTKKMRPTYGAKEREYLVEFYMKVMLPKSIKAQYQTQY